jgi:transcription antitermination factor NusG
MLDDTVYLNDISSKLREGQMVRITTGAFAGVEGRIVRIRKSRRIMVELKGMLAVAATYIPTDELELL